MDAWIDAVRAELGLDIAVDAVASAFSGTPAFSRDIVVIDEICEEHEFDSIKAKALS